LQTKPPQPGPDKGQALNERMNRPMINRSSIHLTILFAFLFASFNALLLTQLMADYTRISVATEQNHHTDRNNKVTKCPPPPDDGNISAPQKHSIGQFHHEKGDPFITQDFWADLVDNRRTFFLRPTERGYPSVEELQHFIRSRTHPITLVINNQVDKSWPDDLSNRTSYELILNETNLHAIYAGNPRNLKGHQTKLRPLPIGLKWNWKYTELFSESKDKTTESYRKLASASPNETEKLFQLQDRTSTVLLRPMANSNEWGTLNYVRDTPALITKRSDIFSILNKTASRTLVDFTGMQLDQETYYKQLQNHRFVISPPGNGLDSHSTWEALLAGCIPIVASSPLNPLYEDLTVWAVNDWHHVTDETVKRVEKEMLEKTYNWEKLFRSYWKDEIYQGLCTI
jgi:hypothetical protein